MSAPDGGERPYDCRMLVRFLQMQSRDARAALIAALLLVPLCVAPTAAARWSAPARPAGCSAALAAAVAPSVVFPDADPTARSGSGMLLWTAPRGCASGASAGEAFGATLAGDDLPGMGRSLTTNAGGLAEVATAAGAATGQVVAVGSTQSATVAGGSTGVDTGALAKGQTASALAEGRTAGAFGAARPLDGPAAPVTASSAYLGDVAIASPVRTRAGWAIAVRVQRHYSETPGRARLVPAGSSPVDAVAATMDYRAEVLLVWASGGAVNARELSPAGALGTVQRLGNLAAGSPDPELRALVSDDGHAIVAWRSQSVAPGGAPTTTIELSISGSGLAFGAPRVLERFRDLGRFVPPAGSLRLLRLSSEAVMIAWTGVDASHYVVRASPVSLRRGAWAPVVISGFASHAPATDAVLADLAAGPGAEAFALWRIAPSSAGGSAGRAGSDSWAIRASRGHYAGQGEVSFTTPELVAAPGPNGPPAVAVDPGTDRALAAWVTLVTLAGGGDVGRIEYALRAPGSPSAPPPAVVSVTHTGRRTADHRGIALVVGLSVLAALAGVLLLGVPGHPGHMRARRG